MPIWARVAGGATVAAVGLLAARDGLHLAWPGFISATVWNYFYNAIEIAAVALCAARVFARRQGRGAWSAITAGLALYSAGDLYYTIVFTNATNIPFPSPADALYLGFYPAVYLGIGLLLRERADRLPAGGWLDGLIGALAVAALGAALLFGTVLADTRGAPLTVATNLAYPLLDLVLLGLLVGIVAMTGFTLRGDWPVLALGFAIFAVVDSIYLVQVASNTYVDNGILDVGWPGAMTVIALAAWQRPGRSLRAHAEGFAGFLVPTVAGLTCLGLEFVDHFHRLGLIAHLLATACLLTVIARLGLSFAENLSMLRASRREAVTDALTGLGNRRALALELESRLGRDPVAPFVVAFYDLDGFKTYNDTFGHQAGDALLARLAARVAAALPDAGVYRMGGDEFCVLASGPEGEAMAARAAGALSERGSTFAVGCSYGTVAVPAEARTAETAMLLADARMYEDKGGRRPSPAAESQGVLLRALAERNSELGQHNDDVSRLVELVGHELGLGQGRIVSMLRAAELHDVDKLAIPDAILHKPGPLDADEWAFMRSHTLIGERIIASAPSLGEVARIVRSTHERWDGAGYPDGLGGETIPLEARVIAVCDAYDAMTTTRPYRTAMSHLEAMAELRRCAGRQFDAGVVEAFARVVGRRADPDALAA